VRKEGVRAVEKKKKKKKRETEKENVPRGDRKVFRRS